MYNKSLISTHDLDDLVHDTATSIASGINNSGVDGQISYLIEQHGDAAHKMIAEHLDINAQSEIDRLQAKQGWTDATLNETIVRFIKEHGGLSLGQIACLLHEVADQENGVEIENVTDEDEG